MLTLIKTYNEKKLTEQRKTQNNSKFEEKRSTRKLNEAKSYIKGDKQIKKWKTGSGGLRAKSHPARFPVCEKGLNKSSELAVVSTALIPALWRQR